MKKTERQVPWANFAVMNRLIFILLLFLGPYTAFPLAYERFEQDGKVGIRDDQGHVVVPASFEALGWSDGSFSLLGEITGYRKGNRWGLLNLKKEYITKAEYLSLTSTGGNHVRVSREVSAVAAKVGCINLKGEVVIPMIYDDLVLQDLHAIVMVKDGARYKYGLVDLAHRVLVPVAYQQITQLGTLRYAVRNFDGKSALFSEEGKQVTEFNIDSLSQFQNDLAVLYKGLHRGVIDRAGSVRVEPVYRDTRILEAGKVQVRKPDTWTIIDFNQRALHHTEADQVVSIGLNRFRLTLNGKCGIVDSLLKVIIPVSFDYVGAVDNEKFVAGQSGRYGLVRTNGSAVLPILFDSVILEGHLVRVRTLENGRTTWNLYDTVGVRKTRKDYDRMEASVQGLYPVSHKDYAGAIDRLGIERIACVYDSLLQITEDGIVVKFKGLYGIISREDVWKLIPQPNRVQLISGDLYLEFKGSLKMLKDFGGQMIYFTDNLLTIAGDHLLEKLPDGAEKVVSFNGTEVSRRTSPQPLSEPSDVQESEGLTLVKRDGKFGFVDSRGRLRIANRYEAAGNFSEGLAPVRLLGKWGFIDKTDQIVIQPVYDRKPVLKDGVAAVTRNGKHGIIDREGIAQLELRYDSIWREEGGSFILFQNGEQGLADGSGKILLEPRFDSICPIDGARVIVSQGGKYGLLTREGLSVFPLIYESLTYQPQTKTFFVRESHAWETIDLK